MTKLRQLWLLTALGAVAVLAGGYFLMVSPQSTKAAQARSDAEAVEGKNAGLRSEIAQLNKQKKGLPAQQAELAKFATKIPNNPALPSLIRALSDAADNAGVDLKSISPTLPEWGKGVDPTTRTEVAGKVTAPNGQVLVSIPVVIHVTGLYSQISQFFGELEGLSRAMLVGGLTVQPDDNDGVAVRGSATAGELIATVENILSADIGAQVMMTAKAPTAPAVTKVAAPADPTSADAK